MDNYEQQDYKIILTALAFLVGVDFNINLTDKLKKDCLKLIKKVKEDGFKRAPKVDLYIVKDSKLEDKETTKEIEKFIKFYRK